MKEWSAGGSIHQIRLFDTFWPQKVWIKFD